MANPIGGPVYIEGAERGDILLIDIEDIEVGDYSWVAIGPKRGHLVNPPAGPNSPANIQPRFSNIAPGLAAQCGTAR